MTNQEVPAQFQSAAHEYFRQYPERLESVLRTRIVCPSPTLLPPSAAVDSSESDLMKRPRSVRANSCQESRPRRRRRTSFLFPQHLLKPSTQKCLISSSPPGNRPRSMSDIVMKSSYENPKSNSENSSGVELDIISNISTSRGKNLHIDIPGKSLMSSGDTSPSYAGSLTPRTPSGLSTGLHRASLDSLGLHQTSQDSLEIYRAQLDSLSSSAPAHRLSLDILGATGGDPELSRDSLDHLYNMTSVEHHGTVSSLFMTPTGPRTPSNLYATKQQTDTPMPFPQTPTSPSSQFGSNLPSPEYFAFDSPDEDEPDEQHLPADVWWWCLSFLSPVELVALYPVCKAWKPACEGAMRFLRKFKVLGLETEPQEKLVEMLAENCVNVQTLHIHRELAHVDSTKIEYMFERLQRIETLWAPGPLLAKVNCVMPSVASLVMGVKDACDIEQLKKFTALRKLTFTRYYQGTVLTSHIMSSMESYPELEYFHTIGFGASPDFLCNLGLLKQLRRLKLVQANLRDSQLRVVAENCPKLRELQLCQNRLITNNGLRKVSELLKNLVHLYINDTEAELHHNDLVITVRKFARLRRLRIQKKLLSVMRPALAKHAPKVHVACT